MPVQFKTKLRKFENAGEKTGWTYIEIPTKVAQKLKPGVKKSYRVKGNLDEYVIGGVSLVPMGDGNFIMAINATMRKAIGKQAGDSVEMNLAADDKIPQVCPVFLACLEDEPAAKESFLKLPPSHQLYYSRWIESAKTSQTIERRIAKAINALALNIDFGTMLRNERDGKIIR